MVLNTEWAQVEIIDLINDGSGLAFGIIGGRSTGVVVKTIIPGGVADRDGRLQSGDHILQIGEVNLRGLGSEQVASVLRQCGVHVRMVVARPIESTSSDYKGLSGQASIVPTKILSDQLELDKHLADNGYNDAISNYSGRDSAPYIYTGQSDIHSISNIVEVVRNPLPIGKNIPIIPTCPPPKGGSHRNKSTVEPLPLDMALREPKLPETETYTVQLCKDDLGLGITVAGYVCEKEEISGIFIKSISRGSAADIIKKLKINDRILKVDDKSVVGLTNHQAVEVLRNSGETVTLLLERYLRGPKYDQLQQAIKANELAGSSPPSPSLSSLPKIPLSLVKLSSLGIEPEPDSRTSLDCDSAILLETSNPDENEIIIDTLDGRKSVQFNICTHESIYDRWKCVIMDDAELIIAEMNKSPLSGLGISLEGTVDVEDGQEVRPHHYIRNILPNGPVGRNNILQSGDELLEVNGIQLFGLNHVEVVSILKQLPCLVFLVCVRSAHPIRIIDTAQDQEAFRARNLLAGSIITFIPNSDKLVKAKSDTSIVSSVASESCSFDSRSKSLEIINGLPMWNDEETVVDLIKTDHGLGFSILDYQDPLDSRSTVIVVRSLIPGSVAQADGRLLPGDRLLTVNGVSVDGVPLDRAVQVLKAAPRGLVRIGVAKPIAAPTTNVTHHHLQQSPDQITDDASKHSQDTDMDDQTCLEDFQECIEEYQECLDVMQLCIEDEESAFSQLDIINHQIADPRKFIKRISLPDTKIKIDEYNNTNKQIDIHTKPAQLIENETRLKTSVSYKTFDCPQIIKYAEEVSEKDSFETCREDSLSDEVLRSSEHFQDIDKTPTNSTHNLTDQKNGFLHAGQVQENDQSVVNDEIDKNVRKEIAESKSSLKMEFNEYKILDDGDDLICIDGIGQTEPILVGTTIEEVEPTVCNTKTNSDLPEINQNRNINSSGLSDDKIESKSISIVAYIIDTILSNIDDNSTHFDSQLSQSKKVFLESMLEEDELQEEIMISSTERNRKSPETPDILEAIQEESQNNSIPSPFEEPFAIYKSAAFSEPCLKPNGSFAALDFFADISKDEHELKSYDNQADSLGGDQFFIVQYPQEDLTSFHKEVSKCLSEPAVILDTHHSLELDTQHVSFTYRINEYYNDIDECLESFRDDDSTVLATSSVALEVGSGTAFKVTVEDDELDDVEDAALLMGLEQTGDVTLGRCRSEPDIRDNTFLTLTYDPGPMVGEQEHRRNSAFIEGRYQHFDGKSSVDYPTALIQSVDIQRQTTDDKNIQDEVEKSNFTDKRWGPIKTVQIHREANQSLGISIVGGKVDLCANELSTGTVLGIFIKKVVANSPAGETGHLKTGDRILEVSGIDIRNVSHERAVEIIRYAKNPITFVIQSIITFNNEEFVNTTLLPEVVKTTSSEISAISEERNDRLISTKSVEFSEKLIASEHVIPRAEKILESSEASEEDEDVRELEGRTRSIKGQNIDRASAANVKRSNQEAVEDPEQEDDFGYTINKVKKKYANLGHSIQMVQLERSGQGLGLSLAGHKDRNCMAVFVCGINPTGAAHRTGGIQVGDEILEVNGVVLHGRCHLNASAIIKGLSGPIFKIIMLRRKAAIDDIAVRPITQFPSLLAEETSEDSYSHYPNVRTISIKKGSQSLGIMIIEGKHADVGQGIFISDIQEGSSAEKAGLEIGEMILAVNKDSLLGSNYDTAANLLKRTEGLVNLVVSNPGKRSASPITDGANKNTNNKPGLKASCQPSRPTTPVPEPPTDPSTNSLHPGKDTTIEITTDNQGLGLFFIGGKDTQIQGGIVIVEIFSNGAASKDKRLQAGDQIVEVNGISLKDATYNTASQALRQTLPKMKLVVYRPEKLDYQTVDSEFVKKPGKGLGLSVMANKTGKGVYISEILSGGCADVEGKIMKGDIISSINGQNIDNSSAEEASALLKTVTGKVMLKLNRYKPMTR